MDELARYTVELRRPRGGWSYLQQATARARRAAEEMQLEGMPVRFLRSIFVPEDDSCFFLYEGPTAAAVRDAAVRAQLGAMQVRQTITEGEHEDVLPVRRGLLPSPRRSAPSPLTNERSTR